MKKKIFLRGLLGFPIGITIGYLITIFISLIWGQNHYSPCVPELVDAVGSEINAVILQAFLCGLLGTGFGMASIVWEAEDWGIVKQTGIYFLIISLVMLPVAYLTYWMEHSIKGFFIYFGIFALIFIIIWIFQFDVGRNNVKKLNESLFQAKNTENK